MLIWLPRVFGAAPCRNMCHTYTPLAHRLWYLLPPHVVATCLSIVYDGLPKTQDRNTLSLDIRRQGFCNIIVQRGLQLATLTGADCNFDPCAQTPHNIPATVKGKGRGRVVHLTWRKRPREGASPVTISQRTTPKLKMSTFSLHRSPISTSGACVSEVQL